MAIYIAIRKVYEDRTSAEFAFGLLDGDLGRLRLDKISGNVSLVDSVLGDTGEAIFSRAAFKVRKHWAAGQIPDRTCWAS
jgi:hypothetical protein